MLPIIPIVATAAISAVTTVVVFKSADTIINKSHEFKQLVKDKRHAFRQWRISRRKQVAVELSAVDG